MSKPTFYITTPIYYPSAKLHIGHAYSTTMADTMRRYKDMQGYDTYFLTGSDEHGMKIQRAAEASGMTPQAYVDDIVSGIQKLWQRLMISNDQFIRTTMPFHHKAVQKFFQKVYDQGDIYLSSYEGHYCTSCETFFTETQVGEDKTCPDCGKPTEWLEEESYFFKMSKYADRWLEYIDAHPEFIQPETRRNEMISFVKQGLEDLCISRTSFDWGIKVPMNDKHVVYVWFDALLNYNPDLFRRQPAPEGGGPGRKVSSSGHRCGPVHSPDEGQRRQKQCQPFLPTAQRLGCRQGLRSRCS